MADKPATVVRTYKGKQQADAARAMERDAAQLAKQGYFPTSQSWAPGQWGLGAFLVAVLLFLVLIGILVFIYMLLVKPDGTLTVTYALREAPPSAQVATEDTVASLKTLNEMVGQGLITPDEFQSKRKELLERM